MARNKVPYRAKLTNGMYKVKKSRVLDRSTAELESLVKREIKETNRRLKKLKRPIDVNKATYNVKTKRFVRPSKEKKLKSYEGLYASKKLYDVGLVNKKGQVKLRGNETRTELINIHQELSSFLKNVTSTRAGIKKVSDSTISTLQLGLDVEPEEAETLYNFFVDPDFKGVQEYIKGSDFMYILNDSVAKNKDSTGFIETIKDYISEDKAMRLNTDVDMINKLSRIYDKYLSV